jgi:hypothetical protein
MKSWFSSCQSDARLSGRPTHFCRSSFLSPIRSHATRQAVFFIYGTFIAGPIYHYWFNQLDLLPSAAFRIRQDRQRLKIVRAYALLKRHGIEVALDTKALPSAKPFHKYTEKAMKIAADQLIFSTAYALIFFVCTGMMSGALDKMRAMRVGEESVLKEESVAKKLTKADRTLEKDLLQLKDRLSDELADIEEEHHEALDRILALVREERANPKSLSWGEIWRNTWAHTKDVYWQTYLVDCAVWPPVQFVNFTFVPLRYQVVRDARRGGRGRAGES